MQYLYLIKCQQFYKIGVANDVENRLAQLSTGNPFDLDVLAIYGFANAEVVERALHQRFANTRVRGEWFGLSDGDLYNFHAACTHLGGIIEEKEPTVSEERIEEAEALAEPVDGAKWNFEAMLADGWRMEKANDGVRNHYWRWAKGSSSEIKRIYGGRLEDLPYPLPDMRLIYRDHEEPLNPPNKVLAEKESVGNAE